MPILRRQELQPLAELKSYLDEAWRTHKQFSEFEEAAEILIYKRDHVIVTLQCHIYDLAMRQIWHSDVEFSHSYVKFFT
jgi:FMN-dependent NADH-azoreductase